MLPPRANEVKEFCKANGLTEIGLELINQSLTHKSYANEIKAKNRSKLHELHNQRLEFLGDTVLGMVIGNELYQLYPDANEGELTKRKSQAVCEPTLAEIGEKISIGKYLRVGKGELATGGNKRSSNIADALESVIGAIFIATGMKRASDFILNHWQPYILYDKKAKYSIDHKSMLQEWLMKQEKLRPEYRVITTEGPDHEKTFHVALIIRGHEAARAIASNRKKAEQKAAFDYLNKHNLV